VRGFKSNGEESWIGDFDSFALGDEKVGHVRLRVFDLVGGYKYTATGSKLAESAGAEDTPAMLIGADFFHAHRVFFDVKDHLILFTYEGGPVFAPQGVDAEGPGRAGGVAAGLQPARLAAVFHEAVH
jgi:hypothetical protein